MSCGEVQMYQAYYPYLYQRAASAAAAAAPGGSVPPAAHHTRHHTPAHHAGPFGSAAGSPFSPATAHVAHQYDRFNVQRSLSDVNSQPSTSSLALPGELYLHSPHLTAAAAASHHHHHHHHNGGGGGAVSVGASSLASHSSGGSVSSPAAAAATSAAGVSPAASPLRGATVAVGHKIEEDVSLHGRSSTEAVGGAGDDDDSDSCSGGLVSGASRAQYVSANCVVFTHYSGDAASVVDEHFSRALDKTSPQHGKETSPMSARNFPPSFWNSHYQPPPSGSLGGGQQHNMTAGAAHHAATGDLYDPYHPAMHGAGGAADPWHSHYQQYTAAAAHHHRAVHDYHHHNMAAAVSAHQYGGLLLPPPSRLSHHMGTAHAQCKPGPADWQHHQTGLDSAAAAYAAGYPTMAGLEAQVQETSKDLYWF